MNTNEYNEPPFIPQDGSMDGDDAGGSGQAWERQDLPRLLPESEFRFQAKDKLRRSAILDFEGSDFELNCIVAAEGDRMTDSNTPAEDRAEIRAFRQMRLTPDAKICMPDKQQLKRRQRRPMVWRVARIAVSAAAVVLLAVFVMYQRSATTSSGTLVQSEGIDEEANQVPRSADKLAESLGSNVVAVQDEVQKTVRTEMSASRKQPSEQVPLQDQDNGVSVSAGEPDDPEQPVPQRMQLAMERMVAPQSMVQNHTTLVTNEETEMKQCFRENQLLSKSFEQEDNSSKLTQFIRNTFLKKELFQRNNRLETQIVEWVSKNSNNSVLEIYVGQTKGTTFTQEYDENGQLTKVCIFTDRDLNYSTKYAKN